MGSDPNPWVCPGFGARGTCKSGPVQAPGELRALALGQAAERLAGRDPAAVQNLLFVGGEIAQEQEWSHERALDWHLLERREHAGIQALVRDLNRLYRDEPGAVGGRLDPSGFWWIEPNDADSNVIAFARGSRERERVLVIVANLSPVPRTEYRLGLPRAGRWREALNTHSDHYGGSDVGNLGAILPEPVPWHGQPVSAEITLPPLAAVWLVPR